MGGSEMVLVSEKEMFKKPVNLPTNQPTNQPTNRESVSVLDRAQKRNFFNPRALTPVWHVTFTLFDKKKEKKITSLLKMQREKF
jgi:hypothetical protein